MFDIRSYADLGQMKIDWLNAHYHFSFANYHNPKRMSLGHLRVINDDIVSAGGGFDFHSHRDMEIITYVRTGAITHEDSLGNHGVTRAGDVQVMSAGAGITHAERNEESVATTLYQIWITPRSTGGSPRFEAKQFPKHESNQLELLVSGFVEHAGTNALSINQDAAMYGAALNEGLSLSQNLHGAGYLLVSKGNIQMGDNTLNQGDGVAITDETSIHFTTLAPSEIVLIDLPAQTG